MEKDPLPLTADIAQGRFRLKQRYELATLYFQLQGQFWTDSTGWLENQNECEWFRVQCSSESFEGGLGLQNVLSELDFSPDESTGINLHGRIPDDIALLTSLTVLDLQNNVITGTFPDTIGGVYRLMVLDFRNNELSGTIPTSIGGLTSLKSFRVDENKLTGTLPEQIGQWTNLTDFLVDNNNLRGSLPVSIGNWESLTVFKVDNNAFGGELPASIGNWTSLKVRHIRLQTSFYFHSDVLPQPASSSKWFFVYVNIPRVYQQLE